MVVFPGTWNYIRTNSINQTHHDPEARVPVLCLIVMYYPITSGFLQIVDDVVWMMCLVDPVRPHITIWNWKTGNRIVVRLQHALYISLCPLTDRPTYAHTLGICGRIVAVVISCLAHDIFPSSTAAPSSSQPATSVVHRVDTDARGNANSDSDADTPTPNSILTPATPHHTASTSHPPVAVLWTITKTRTMMSVPIPMSITPTRAPVMRRTKEQGQRRPVALQNHPQTRYLPHPGGHAQHLCRRRQERVQVTISRSAPDHQGRLLEDDDRRRTVGRVEDALLL